MVEKEQGEVTMIAVTLDSMCGGKGYSGWCCKSAIFCIGSHDSVTKSVFYKGMSYTCELMTWQKAAKQSGAIMIDQKHSTVSTKHMMVMVMVHRLLCGNVQLTNPI